MKDFVKMVLAVMTGIFLMGILGFFMFITFIGSLAAAGSVKPALPRTGVLEIDMSVVSVSDQGQPADPMSVIQSGSINETITLWSAVQAINNAASDPGVKFIYLKPDGGSASITQLQEIRTALLNFRSSGKPVISYIENPSTGSYYLATAADKVFMTSHPGGSNMVTGIGSQMIFLGDLLDKFQVNVQLIRHGKYKSAGEMFTRSEASPENLEQNQVMVNSMWKSISSEICKSRGISEDYLNSSIDNLELNLPEDFLSHSLVDGLLTKDELKSKLATYFMADDFSKVRLIGFNDYVKAKVFPNLRARKKIAIIYAEGEIVDGTDPRQVSGDAFSRMISAVRADSTVKAVVLRVNSPGGSVIGSDKIRDEIALTQKCKPVIASYGDYAASGGYWISSACDKIFSNSTTLTGSIGVFGMIPDLSRTIKNVAHVNITSVTSNKHGDMYSLMRPFDKDENAFMQASIEDVYEKFVSLVAEGRNKTKEYVDSIAQGRVWTGDDALRLGLVDEIGTLENALHYAASVASPTADPSLDSWQVVEYPAQMTFMQMLLASMGNMQEEPYVLAGKDFRNTVKAVKDWSKAWEKDGDGNLIFARMPYEMRIR